MVDENKVKKWCPRCGKEELHDPTEEIFSCSGCLYRWANSEYTKIHYGYTRRSNDE